MRILAAETYSRILAAEMYSRILAPSPRILAAETFGAAPPCRVTAATQNVVRVKEEVNAEAAGVNAAGSSK